LPSRGNRRTDVTSRTTAAQATDDSARTIAGIDTPSEANALINRSIEIVD